MATYIFYIRQTDTSIFPVPELEYGEGSSREDAIVRFARKHGLTVDSAEEVAVWFLLPDRGAVRYKVTERK